jgi:hypothetical protein
LSSIFLSINFRELKLKGASFKDISFSFDVKTIDAEYFIFVRKHYDSSSFCSILYLLKLNAKEAKCQLVDEKTIRGDFYGIVLDEADPHKFIIYTDSSNQMFV